MARRRSGELIETVSGVDERGVFMKYKYSDGNEYTVRCFIKDTSVKENAEEETYMDQIAPQMMPFDEYLRKNNLAKQEWWRQHEEAIQSRIHNCEIRTTIIDEFI